MAIREFFCNFAPRFFNNIKITTPFMRKQLLVLLAFVACTVAKADEIVLPGTATQILTLKATVGNEVSIKPGVYGEFDIFAVDFGNGEQVIDSVGHQNKGVCENDGTETWPQKLGTIHTGITEFKGIAAGDGTIKVYGTDNLWYLAVSGAVPETFDQAKLKTVEQFTISKVSVDAIDLTGFNDLKSFGFSQGSLKNINIKNNVALTKLTINNNTASNFDSILESLDLSGNVNLEELNVMGASAAKSGILTALDLSNNPKIDKLYAQYNALTSVVFPAGAALSFLNLQNNQLESIDMSVVESFKDTYLNNNQLTAVDLSKLAAGANLYLDGNLLTEVTVPVSVKNLQLNNNKLTKVSIVDATVSCKLENNQLTLATIPAQPASLNTASKAKKFTYAPQVALPVAETVNVIDLSAQLAVAKGELDPANYVAYLAGTTTYTFKTVGDTELVEGTDYVVIEPGKFRFIKEQSEKVHAEMLNTVLPKFTAAVPFKTSEFNVLSGAILTLTGPVGEEVSLTFGVWDTEDTYGVDFGDGNVQVAKVGIDNKGPVREDGTTPSATKFAGTVAGDGIIKVYGANDLWYFNLSGGAMPTAFDQAKLMNVVQMSITGANVESVVLPAYTKMTQFSFNNSPVKSVDVTNVPSMTSLTINSTTASKFKPQLESIDLSQNTELTYLSLQGNQNDYGKLTAINLSTNTKLENVYLQYNALTEVRTDGTYPNLKLFNAQNNKLTYLSWDKLTTVKGFYLSDNEFAGDFVLKNATFENLQLKNNRLTSLKVNNVTKQLWIEGNNMTLATIPAQPAGLNSKNKTKQFTYAPQAALAVDETLNTLDLSALLTVVKGELDANANYASWLENVTTTFSFVTAGGTTLVEGTDYEVTEPGKFKFLTAQTEKIHGVMLNSALPKFTEAIPFVTTEFTVSEATGIRNINAKTADGKVYNLQGVEVENPTKGLYIQNGKVVLK